MTHIERIHLVDGSKLHGATYFQSLFEEAYRLNLLLDSDVERIQLECLALLAHQVERYNAGDSSSILVEAAENIMRSNLYTIGVQLKSFAYPEDAIEALKESKVAALYAEGKRRIETKMKTAKGLYVLVLQTKMEIAYSVYNDTIVEGIKGFFKRYSPEFAAHEIHITADYPLCHPIQDLVGIEFIVKYLESVYYENLFCQSFSPVDVHHLLCGFNTKYDGLVFNLCEQVLTAAIGCTLAKVDARPLDISASGLATLQRTLWGKTRDEIGSLVHEAYREFEGTFPAKSAVQEQYIARSLPAIISRIAIAMNLGTLEKVFVLPQYPDQQPKLAFLFGEKMDDAQYRAIVQEIMQCRNVADKLAIIKSQVHTLADIEDLLMDAGLESHEIAAILQLLQPIEIAALVKRHPLQPDMDTLDMREAEHRLRHCLQAYITSFSQENRQWIEKAAAVMSDEETE